MIDFKELPQDGEAFELLVRELLVTTGLRVFWSGRGPDGGRDLLADESYKGLFDTHDRRWLVQCKHRAHSRGSVGVNDLDDIVDSCKQHNAEGYILMCSTCPSSALVRRLEGITANSYDSLTATFWDGSQIEQMLDTAQRWPVAQRYFPRSTQAGSMRLHATGNTYHWIGNYFGHYIHLHNRIGSVSDFQLECVRDSVDDIRNISLPQNNYLRMRAVYHDDKNGYYRCYVDYLFPKSKRRFKSNDAISKAIRKQPAVKVGMDFDLCSYEIDPYSDHFHPDHHDYYDRYDGIFFRGYPRSTTSEMP
jgi:hypothetical protein